MEDWAEVHRLFHREGMAKAAIARRLGMSRNTVDRLLGLREPPRYERAPQGSQLGPFVDRIAAMLAEDPAARATVIRERLRPLGHGGGITILKDHLAKVRPGFLAARAFQRTGYEPGGIGQVDWWHTGALVPVGRGLAREAFGLVTTLPWSGAHATVFSLSRTVGDVCPSLAGCTERLGGVPDAYVFDNDASVVASREGGRARLHPEVSGLLGALRSRAIVLRPRRPTSKGAVERTIGYLETSFLPLRTFSSSRISSSSTTPGRRRSPSPATCGAPARPWPVAGRSRRATSGRCRPRCPTRTCVSRAARSRAGCGC